MHPSEPELQSLADGELPAEDERGLRLHLERCAECAARLRGLESADSQVAQWLALLDHPVPRVEPAMLMARARRRGAPPGLLAAGLAALLVAAAAAAAVIPGSPVERFVGGVLTEWRGGGGPPAPPPAPEVSPPRQSGVSFVPEPELEVAFLRSQPEGVVRISLMESREVRIRQVGGAAAYSVEPAELVVDNRDADGSYELLLPRSLRRARVRIGDRLVFEMNGAAISSRGSVDGEGRHVVPLAGHEEVPRSTIPPRTSLEVRP